MIRFYFLLLVSVAIVQYGFAQQQPDAVELESGTVTFEMTSPHTSDSARLLVGLRPGQAATTLGTSDQPSSQRSIFFFDRDSVLHLYRAECLKASILSGKISAMYPSLIFTAEVLPETRQILGYPCHKFIVRSTDTLISNMIFTGWMTLKIKTALKPMLQGVELPGFPLEFSMYNTPASSVADATLRAITIDRTVDPAMFEVPANAEWLNSGTDDEDEEEPYPIEIRPSSGWEKYGAGHKISLSHAGFQASVSIELYDTEDCHDPLEAIKKSMQSLVEAVEEGRNIPRPAIEVVDFQGKQALQCTYCYDSHTRCRLYRKFSRGIYLYNLILEAPAGTFQQAVQDAEPTLNTLDVGNK